LAHFVVAHSADSEFSLLSSQQKLLSRPQSAYCKALAFLAQFKEFLVAGSTLPYTGNSEKSVTAYELKGRALIPGHDFLSLPV
jgi:hypothetical protein